jgi:hypothetical protein
MTVYRDIFGLSVAVTPSGETYVDPESKETKSRRSGISLKTSRGKIEVSSLELLALCHLAQHDPDISPILAELKKEQMAALKAL